MSNLVNLIMAAVLNLVSPGETTVDKTQSTETIKAIMTDHLNKDTVVPTIRFEAGKC